MSLGAVRSLRSDYLFLTIMFFSIHGVLLIYDLNNPEIFLLGDRSESRYQQITEFTGVLGAGESLVNFISSGWLIGDYIFHAIAYMVADRMGFILLQVFATFVSFMYLYRLTLLLTGSAFASKLAALIYMLLPHSLVYPHFLTSESLSNSLIIISFYYLARYLSNQGSTTRCLILSGIFISFSIIIRPIVLLFPIIVFTLVIISLRERNTKALFAYLGVAYIPLLIWMSFMLATTGIFTMGNTGSTLGLSLHTKVNRMLVSEHKSQVSSAPNQEGPKTLSPTEYIKFVTNNPRLLGNLLVYDTANILLNSGSNKLFGYYLKLYDADSKRSAKWRKITDQHGILTGIGVMLEESTGFVIATFFSMLLWWFILLGSLYGFYIFCRDREYGLTLKLIFTIYPLYIVIFTVALVSGVRSGHRSSFEFLLCLMFSFAVITFLSRFSKQPDKLIHGKTVSKKRRPPY